MLLLTLPMWLSRAPDRCFGSLSVAYTDVGRLLLKVWLGASSGEVGCRCWLDSDVQHAWLTTL
jgi:hypothetical protein